MAFIFNCSLLAYIFIKAVVIAKETVSAWISKESTHVVVSKEPTEIVSMFAPK